MSHNPPPPPPPHPPPPNPPPPPSWGGLDIPEIIAATAAAATSSASNYLDPAHGPSGGCISALKGIHLRFVCGVAMYKEVLPIWGFVAASPSDQDILTILPQFLLTRYRVLNAQ